MAMKLQLLLVVKLAINAVASAITVENGKADGTSIMLQDMTGPTRHDWYKYPVRRASVGIGEAEVYIDFDGNDAEFHRNYGNAAPRAFGASDSHTIRGGYDVVDGPGESGVYVGYVMNSRRGEPGKDRSNGAPDSHIVRGGYDIVAGPDGSKISFELGNDGREGAPGEDDSNAAPDAPGFDIVEAAYGVLDGLGRSENNIGFGVNDGNGGNGEFDDTAFHIPRSDYVEFDRPDEADVYNFMSWANGEDKAVDNDYYIARGDDHGPDDFDRSNSYIKIAAESNEGGESNEGEAANPC